MCFMWTGSLSGYYLRYNERRPGGPCCNKAGIERRDTPGTGVEKRTTWPAGAPAMTDPSLTEPA